MTDELLSQIIESLQGVGNGMTAPEIALSIGSTRPAVNSLLYRHEGFEFERIGFDNPPKWKLADPTQNRKSSDLRDAPVVDADYWIIDDSEDSEFDDYLKRANQRSLRACPICGTGTERIFCSSRCRNRSLDSWIVETITPPRFTTIADKIKYAIANLDVPLLRISEIEQEDYAAELRNYSVLDCWELFGYDTKRLIDELKSQLLIENQDHLGDEVTNELSVSLSHLSRKYIDEVLDSLRNHQLEVDSKSLVRSSVLNNVKGISSLARKNITAVLSRAHFLEDSLFKRRVDQLTLEFAGASQDLCNLLNLKTEMSITQVEQRFEQRARSASLELKDEMFELSLAFRSYPFLPTFSIVENLELMIPKVLVDAELQYRSRLISILEKQPARVLTPSVRRLITTLKLIGGISEGQTLDQLGAEFGVSRERVRQLLQPIVAQRGVSTLREFRALSQSASIKREVNKEENRALREAEISAYIREHPGICVAELKAVFPFFIDETERACSRHRALLLDQFPLTDDIESGDRVDIIESLKAASLLSFPLTGNAYDRLLNEGYIKGVSRVRIMQVYGTWSEACLRAEVESGEPLKNVSYVRRWSEHEMIRVVGQFLIDEDLEGRAGGVHTYGKWRSVQESADSLPSEGTIRNQVHGSWKRVKDLALLELRKSWDNPQSSQEGIN
jgi:endogenous inhibitor of DNA gyrase (YacG/DUF329 family)